MKIAKCANIYGVATVVRRYKSDFPKDYREHSTWLADEVSYGNENKGTVRVFINNQRKAGGTINRHTVCDILMGLIKSNLVRYGNLLEFVITDGWHNYLYKRMN